MKCFKIYSQFYLHSYTSDCVSWVMLMVMLLLLLLSPPPAWGRDTYRRSSKDMNYVTQETIVVAVRKGSDSATDKDNVPHVPTDKAHPGLPTPKWAPQTLQYSDLTPESHLLTHHNPHNDPSPHVYRFQQNRQEVSGNVLAQPWTGGKKQLAEIIRRDPGRDLFVNGESGKPGSSTDAKSEEAHKAEWASQTAYAVVGESAGGVSPASASSRKTQIADGTLGSVFKTSETAGTASEEVESRRSRQIGPNGSTWSESRRWITHLCSAQCDAFCTWNVLACQDSQCTGTRGDQNWITRCRGRDAQEFTSFTALEESDQTNIDLCYGSCSLNLLQNQNDAGYFIPSTPQVVLVRDLTNHSVTLTWSRPATSEPIVYVVQEREEGGPQHLRHWTEAHLVMGGGHFTRSNLDVCSTPTYRVAAVSRFGSRWFSEESTTPAITPEKPRMFRVTGTEFQPYDSDNGHFTITVSWRTPTGFLLKDLQAINPFILQPTVRCGSRTFPDAIEQNHSYTDSENSFTFTLVEEAVDCEVILMLTATSACDHLLESDIAYLTLNFSCPAIKDFYDGRKCDRSDSYVPPHNVENVHVTVLPTGQHGVRAHVTWSPPRDLGSEGRVDYYTVFYGFIHPTFRWGFNNGLFGNITVPGNVLQADVAVPTSANDGDVSRFGILVMPGVNGHTIENPIGIMHAVPTPTFPNGTTLLDDDDLVVYHTNDDPQWVEVFWTRPIITTTRELAKRDSTGVALMWGRVTKVDATVDAVLTSGDVAESSDATNGSSDVSGEQNTTYTRKGKAPFVGSLVDPDIIILDEDRGERSRD